MDGGLGVAASPFSSVVETEVKLNCMTGCTLSALYLTSCCFALLSVNICAMDSAIVFGKKSE